MKNKINVLSLFDGISAGQLSLKQLGIEVENYFASEIDRFAMEITKKNFPETKFVGDVLKVEYHDGVLMNEEEVLHKGKIDLIIGGSPCQGFSFAGKQLNFEDPRSKLFFEFVRLLNDIKKTNPDVKFLLENVRMKQEYQDVISEYLGVEPVAINSNLVSAQNRYRLYWTNIVDHLEQPEDKEIFLKDILEKDVDEKFYLTEKNLKHLSRDFGSKGKNQTGNKKSCTLTASMGTGGGNVPFIAEGFAIRGRYNENKKVVQKLEKNGMQKANSITTVQKDSMVRDGKKYRRFTPIECERLQTMPDNYTAGISNSQRYKALGNGWTVEVIMHILKNLKCG